MIEPNQPGPAVLDDELRQIAHVILKRFDEGDKMYNALLQTPDGRGLRVIVSRRRHLLFGRRLKVSLEDEHPCCKSCRETVAGMAGRMSVGSIGNLLQQVVNTLQNCNCSRNVGGAALPSAPEPGPSSAALRISPDLKGRVKIIAPNEPTVNTALAIKGKREPTIRVKDSGGVTVLDSSRATATAESGRAYAITCIRFFCDAQTQVEVTTPHHICDELILHCRESNRHKNEVGGLLVGYVDENKREPDNIKRYRVVMTNLIRFKPSESSVSHLHINEASWVHVNQVFEEQYVPQKKKKLGWYHTHPTQGIFFSPPDRDTHTNFQLPYQFALVIDPRVMEAGLMYWVNYPQAVSDPVIFPLKGRAGASGSSANVTRLLRERGTDPALPLSRLRLFLFFVCTVIVFGHVITVSPPYHMTPSNASLLAFNLFIFLRLCNAQFFRPERPLERRVLDIAQRGSTSFVRWFNGISPLPFIYVSTLAVMFLVVVLVIYFSTGESRSPRVRQNHAAPPTAGDNLIANGSAASARNRNHVSLLRLFETESAFIVSYGENQSAVFTKGANGWQPQSPEQEQNFLRQAFNLNLGDASDVARFQKWLSGGKGSGGRWGPEWRILLIGKLKEARESRNALSVPQTDEQQQLSVQVN